MKDVGDSDEVLGRRVDALLAGSEIGRGFVQTTDEDTGAAVWIDKSAPGREIRLADEGGPDRRYFSVGAEDESQIDRVAGLLQSAFTFHRLSDLIENASACDGAGSHWITLMAVASNREKNAKVREVVENALRRPEVACRRSAALAAGVLRWPELRPALESALGLERDGRNRTVLQFVLNQLPH